GVERRALLGIVTVAFVNSRDAALHMVQELRDGEPLHTHRGEVRGDRAPDVVRREVPDPARLVDTPKSLGDSRAVAAHADAREDPRLIVYPACFEGAQQLDGRSRERNAMRTAVLRPLARDRPDRLLQIEVFPSHRAQLPATLRREEVGFEERGVHLVLGLGGAPDLAYLVG